MIDADELHDAEQEALGRLAQMDLALAERLHALAMEAEDPRQIAEHTRSYQRASRCVRQTIMLRARLRLDREKHLAAITAPRRAADFDDDDGESRIDVVGMRIDGRIMDLQEAASRIVAQARPDRTRAERAEQLDRIDAWIDEEVHADEDFGLQDLDDHVLRLCRAFDLPEALGRRFRDLPRPPREAEGEGASGADYLFQARRETG